MPPSCHGSLGPLRIYLIILMKISGTTRCFICGGGGKRGVFVCVIYGRKIWAGRFEDFTWIFMPHRFGKMRQFKGTKRPFSQCHTKNFSTAFQVADTLSRAQMPSSIHLCKAHTSTSWIIPFGKVTLTHINAPTCKRSTVELSARR